MIRVCHIVNLITGKADGVYAHLKMIFENSDKTKFQHYLIFQGGEKIEKELSEMGVIVFVSASLKKKISLRTFNDVYRFLKSNEIDIVQTHLIKPYAISGIVNIILRKKFIFNHHGIFLKNNPYYSFIERGIYSIIHYLIFLFGKVDVVLVPSKRNKELLSEETSLFPKPCVYYNGYFSNQRLSEPNTTIVEQILVVKKENLILAVIGRLEIQKRIDRALELFSYVSRKEKNLFMLIFGNGKLRDNLEERSRELNIEKKVIFFDFISHLNNYYKYFDVLLFTSDWEGMPLTMWEAMANQVPIIAPDVGGFKEILVENNCGLIYEPGNLIDAEKIILKLINDTNLRKLLGENGKSLIDKKYNEKKFIDQIEQIYSNLISG